MEPQNESKVTALKSWIKKSGCIVHPSLEIPGHYNGVQGIGTKDYLPHKTVIIAIPSQLIITVPRCYNDPQLKSLFKGSDQLFDYQVDEQAEFNILCVFIMYQKLHIDKSLWKEYLTTIAEPQTAVDWPDADLKGLNKSLLEEILHVRRQCRNVETNLCNYLITTPQFKHLSRKELIDLFTMCYRSVLTRCFGYYFSSACMIPVADLMNHSCDAVDHQLIHTDFEKGKGFRLGYRERKHKLNCELLELQKPPKSSLPFRLDYLLKNNLVQNDKHILSQLRRKQIDDAIYKFLNKKRQEMAELEDLDFCQEDDEEDNDTDEETQHEKKQNLDGIRRQEKEQMVEFQKHYVKIQRYIDVENRAKKQFAEEFQEKTNSKEETLIFDNAAENMEKQEQKTVPESPKQKDQTNLTGQTQSSTNLTGQIQSSSKKETSKPKTNLCPIEYINSSSSEESDSDEEQWCLDESCYFTMSTCAPVNAGSELYNSYGSRTNKFLLVWYGFAYRDNYYDSVTLRMQALFSPKLPQAADIVLDTYVGGQGLRFKKNDKGDQVAPEEVSREFRLKRTGLCLELIMFIRLFLLNYYKGEDLYKIFVTFPSSYKFQQFMLQYIKDIIRSLYARYPLEIINSLKQSMETETNPQTKCRTNFKIIYLEEQRSILDINMEAINTLSRIIERLKGCQTFEKSVYADVPMEIMRIIRDYLIELRDNFNYVRYEQKSMNIQTESQETQISQK